jgi:putative transposase
VGGNIAVGDSWIELPKVGRIRTVVSRPLKGRIVSVTVKRHGSGRHYVSVLCEEPSLPAVGPMFLLPPTGRTVAIDLGIKSYATLFDSDGHVSVISNPRHFGRLEERLAIEQRKLAGKQKRDANGHESNGRRRRARKVARVHDKQTTGDAKRALSVA